MFALDTLSFVDDLKARKLPVWVNQTQTPLIAFAVPLCLSFLFFLVFLQLPYSRSFERLSRLILEPPPLKNLPPLMFLALQPIIGFSRVREVSWLFFRSPFFLHLYHFPSLPSSPFFHTTIQLRLSFPKCNPTTPPNRWSFREISLLADSPSFPPNHQSISIFDFVVAYYIFQLWFLCISMDTAVWIPRDWDSSDKKIVKFMDVQN